jgi:hypothetical protein
MGQAEFARPVWTRAQQLLWPYVEGHSQATEASQRAKNSSLPLCACLPWTRPDQKTEAWEPTDVICRVSIWGASRWMEKGGQWLWRGQKNV